MITQRCSEMVWRDTWHKGQCSKIATVTRDGKSYCSIHDPEYVKQKEAKRKAKYQAESCKCGYHFPYSYYHHCPLCGTKRNK